MIQKKTSRSYRLFKQFIHRNHKMVSDSLDVFFNGIKSGAKDTKKTRLIIQTYISKGEIDKEDEKFLKFYIYDMLKVAGIGIPFVLLPGASIIIPFLIKAAEKRNIDIIPSNFKNKTNT